MTTLADKMQWVDEGKTYKDCLERPVAAALPYKGETQQVIISEGLRLILRRMDEEGV